MTVFVGELEEVVFAADDFCQGGEGAAAGTGAGFEDEGVVEAVADDGLGCAVEVGDDGDEDAGFLVEPFLFDVDEVFVEMEGSVGAGGGEEAFGGLIDLVDGLVEEGGEFGLGFFGEDFGDGDDFFEGEGGGSNLLGAGNFAEDGGGGEEEVGLEVDEGIEVFREGGEEVEEAELDATFSFAGFFVEGAVGAEEEGDFSGGEEGAGEGFFEDAASPLGAFFFGGEEEAAVSAGAGREADGEFVFLAFEEEVKVAGFFGF